MTDYVEKLFESIDMPHLSDMPERCKNNQGSCIGCMDYDDNKDECKSKDRPYPFFTEDMQLQLIRLLSDTVGLHITSKNLYVEMSTGFYGITREQQFSQSLAKLVYHMIRQNYVTKQLVRNTIE